MNKPVAFVLMLIYFIVNTGFTVSMHYCMDKFDSAKIDFTSNDECGKCGMTISDSNGCCRDEVKVVKLQQDQTQAFLTLVNFTLSPVITAHINYIFPEPVNLGVEVVAGYAHAPPLIDKQDTYLNNCVFRI